MKSYPPTSEEADRARVAVTGRPFLEITLGLIALGLLSGIASCAASLTSPSDPEFENEAITQCRQAVLPLLRWQLHPSFNEVATGAPDWDVVGTVGAENSFGTSIRSNFQCSVDMRESDPVVTVDYVEQVISG